MPDELTPSTNIEKFLAKTAGESVELPEPATRIEKYLSKIASEQTITEATDNWLDEHIDPSTGYVLDSTLTMNNAAPPASAVGDLKSAIDSFDRITFITPEMYGAKGDGETDDSTAINSAVATGIPVYFGAKTYLINSYISVPSNAVLIGNNTVIHMPAKSSLGIVFNIVEVDNVIIDGFSVVSERTQQESPPAGKTHESPLGSNVHGFDITESHDITIKNIITRNLKADFWLQNASSDASYNINIENVNSANATMPLYANYSTNVHISNYYAIPAEEMGSGDHCLYISDSCEDWVVENSTFINPDEYYGQAITGHPATASNAPKNINFINCKIDSKSAPSFYIDAGCTYNLKGCKITKSASSPANVLLGGKGFYDVCDCLLNGETAGASLISGASIKMRGGEFYGNTAFICFDGITIKIIDSIIHAENITLQANAAVNSATIEFINSTIISTTGNYFFSVSTNGLSVKLLNCTFLRINTNACIIFSNSSAVTTAANYIIMGVTARTTKNNTATLFYSALTDALVSGLFLGNTLYS